MVEREFPLVNLVRQESNLGFGGANNIGLDLASSDLILFLNSDAYVQGDAISVLCSVMEDTSVAACGPKLLNMDGSLQESVAGRLTLSKVFLEQTYLDVIARKVGKGYWRTIRLPMDRKSDVDQVMGACFMMRKSSGERFDERFFLYCEDTDLCARLVRHGRIVYQPAASVVHELGSSSSQNRWLAVARYNLGKELYFRIHHGAVASTICWCLNRLGAFLRLVPGIFVVTKNLREKKQIFAKVLFARSSELNPRLGKRK